MTSLAPVYPKNKWLIAVAVTFGTLMGTIDTSIVNVALPHLRGTLSASVEEITWVSTAYVVAAVIIMPLTAWLGMRFGRKRIYLAGLVLFLIGSFFCGAARTLPTLVLFRILQGIGAGSLQPTEQAILRETFPPNEQGMAMGLYGFAVMLGPAIGPTLGGYIVDNYAWPWIFYINLPVGLLGLVMVSRVVHDPPYLERVKGGVDWWGMGLLVVGLGALQTLLEQGEQNNWFESKMDVLYAAIATASLVMFIVWELTVDKPAVNLRVLRNRSLATGTAIGAVLGAVLFSTLFLLPIYMQEFLGYDAMQTGLALMPRSLVMLVTIPIVGAIYNKVSPRIVISFGLLLGAFTCFQMSRFTLTTSHEEILWPQMIQGVALACIFIPLSTVALATIDRRRMSDATGLNNLVRQLGGSFGVAIFAAALSRFTTEARQGLIAHVTPGDPAVASRVANMSAVFTRAGVDAQVAAQRVLAMLDRQVSIQASMLAFDRAFFFAGLLFAASVPLVVLLDDGRKNKPAAGQQEHMAVEI
ncbi:MAG TPA: DHA2 family efflux MFS transporter permease subunit [Polyangiaceae bacterium]|jgi:DHA2 family multidrug resistance protein